MPLTIMRAYEGIREVTPIDCGMCNQGDYDSCEHKADLCRTGCVRFNKEADRFKAIEYMASFCLYKCQNPEAQQEASLDTINRTEAYCLKRNVQLREARKRSTTTFCG
jgi:hypothetical protein